MSGNKVEVASLKKSYPSGKDLIVSMPDGTKWAIPLSFIAREYANYWNALNENTPEADSIYYRDAYDNPKIAIEFARINILWRDVKADAEPVLPYLCFDDDAYQDGWSKGKMEVVDSDTYDASLPTQDKDAMRCYLDGDALCITRLDFEDLATSPAMFIEMTPEQMVQFKRLKEAD